MNWLIAPHCADRIRPRPSSMATALMITAIGAVGVSAAVAYPARIAQSPYLSPPVFDSGEHPAAVVSELGVLSRGMVLDEDRVVLLDGRTLLFVNVRTGELWTAGGEGGGPGEFAGSGGALGLYRGQDALTVWDLNNDYRLTTFSYTGDVLGTRRFDVSSVEFFEERDYRHNEIAPAIDRMRFDGDGRLWMRHYVMPGANTKTWTVWDWDGGSTTFSVGMPASESLLDVRGRLVLLRVRSELGVDRAVIRQLVFG